MSNNFGERLHLTIFGQSHSEAIGMVLDGLPAGEAVDLEAVRAFLGRRAPGKNSYSTARREADEPELLSGLVEGHTCGAPLAMLIRNTDARSRDYDKLRRTPRPMHADYPAYVKYRGFNDIRGGGQYSGRLTAPLCIAGAVCLQILGRQGVHVGAHIASIGPMEDRRWDPACVTEEELLAPGEKPFPVLDDGQGAAMREEIEAARMDLDSVGGAIEGCILGLPAGLGDPMFHGVENRLSQALFAVPGVKGVEFGAGFEAARLRGSEHNDGYCYEAGAVRTGTNRHGGILGGMTTGMPVLFRAALKPTPSIGRPQHTVDLFKKENADLAVTGRHDPCIVPRAVPCIEAAAALTALDLILCETSGR